ncbi:swi5-dependent recombination DNA repair protein 1 homolog [Penaeus chinensis]|uniref:swi5-dependent recombination DNA repair protein 1 homolog n=1 Tax=Penaeus chinensis TaxID=139456 RepID=UPI001FB57CDE|nr:swi5-dependent recombination DNA repair protein 1 homolog [Penaeus chinensis]
MSAQKRKASDTEDSPSSEEPRQKFLHRDASPSKDKESELQEIKSRVNQKQEVLRKLQLVRMYRNKPEMQDLDTVTAKWLQVCQEALQELLIKVKEQMSNEMGQEELTLTQLVNKLGLDPELLMLDPVEDCFVT